MSGPTNMTEKIALAEHYLAMHEVIYGDAVPSIAGLARATSMGRTSIYNYRNASTEFDKVMVAIQTEQERLLLNGGLRGTLNSNIVKLMLAKHDYSDKSTIDLNTDVKDLTEEQLNYIIKHGKLPAPA